MQTYPLFDDDTTKTAPFINHLLNNPVNSHTIQIMYKQLSIQTNIICTS